MVNNISKAYKSNEARPLNPQTKSTEKPRKSEEVQSTGALNHAARISADLRDKVEISQEARNISATKTTFGEDKVSNDTAKAIGGNWYSTGYAFALDALDE